MTTHLLLWLSFATITIGHILVALYCLLSVITLVLAVITVINLILRQAIVSTWFKDKSSDLYVLHTSIHTSACNYGARCNDSQGQIVSDHVSEMSVHFEINRTKCPCILQILI